MKQIDLDALRDQVQSAIDDVVNRLRALETQAQHRLNEGTIEQQRLETFLDELRYRLQLLSRQDEPHVTITGPLNATQIAAIQGQESALNERRGDLGKFNTQLEQLTTRLAWLTHQIESACRWVLAPVGADQEGEPDNGRVPDAGEQVMWAQIIMGQEAERARLAREIHDGPAQVLANTVLRLQFVEQMRQHDPMAAQEELVRLRMAMQASLQDLRRFLFNLRPASLSDAGLLATVRYYAQDYSEQFGIPVELNLPENLVLSPNQELVVFRVMQEALQNAQKHAQATRVVVDMQQRPGGPFTMSISDNGKGFDPKLVRQSRPSSSGLVSMRERAATVGGTLQVESNAGVGTTITLSFPLPKVS